MIAVLITLCVALPCLAVLGWMRLSSRGTAIAASVVCLIVGNLSAAALTAAVANREGDFYTSWSQLFGAGSGSPPPAVPVTDPASRAGAGAGGSLRSRTDTAFSSRGEWATKGRLDRVEVRGASSQLTSQALVYLPPQYFQPGRSAEAFPAVEASPAIRAIWRTWSRG